MEFITCPSCSLKHSPRPDGQCPRCQSIVSASNNPFQSSNAPPTSVVASADGTPIPGLTVLGLAVVLALAARVTHNEALFGAAALVVGLANIVAGIWVLIEAFGMGVGEGLLTLCVPCYVIYFVFAKCQNRTLRWLYGMSFVSQVAFAVIIPQTMLAAQ